MKSAAIGCLLLAMLRPTLALLILVLASGAAAQPPLEHIARLGEAIEWRYADQPKRVRYRVADVVLEIEGEALGDPEFPMSRPLVRVTMPAFAPIQLEGMETSQTFPHRLSVGRWGDGRPYVLFQSFTGGAHCCNHIEVVLPEGGRLVAISLGNWDGDYLEEPPGDVDGDGEIDFVFRDNRFLYTFSSYAGSRAPPRIFNLVGGEAIDVSAEARYAPLFRAAMAEDRPECLAGGPEANSPCAAYLAEAARLGEFDRAWREMLPVYERNPQFGLPNGCRVPAEYGACPQSEAIEYPDFPSALRSFLEETGYLPRRD